MFIFQVLHPRKQARNLFREYNFKRTKQSYLIASSDIEASMLRACVNLHQIINFNVLIVIGLLHYLIISDTTIINFLGINSILWLVSNIASVEVNSQQVKWLGFHKYTSSYCWFLPNLTLPPHLSSGYSQKPWQKIWKDFKCFSMSLQGTRPLLFPNSPGNSLPTSECFDYKNHYKKYKTYWEHLRL